MKDTYFRIVSSQFNNTRLLYVFQVTASIRWNITKRSSTQRLTPMNLLFGLANRLLLVPHLRGSPKHIGTYSSANIIHIKDIVENAKPFHLFSFLCLSAGCLPKYMMNMLYFHILLRNYLDTSTIKNRCCCQPKLSQYNNIVIKENVLGGI